jgi:hypothetical protein
MINVLWIRRGMKICWRRVRLLKVNVMLKVGQEAQINGVLEIDEYKLEGLTEEEIEAAIQVNVSSWANSQIRIEWEVFEEEEQE